jgi:hypothetical protein
VISKFVHVHDDDVARPQIWNELVGMRASEIISRGGAHLDDEGRLLWIPETKTEAGKRTLPVPEFLRPYLSAIAKGKEPEDRLFGRHWRDWPREVGAADLQGSEGARGDRTWDARASMAHSRSREEPRLTSWPKLSVTNRRPPPVRATSRAKRSPAPISGASSQCLLVGALANHETNGPPSPIAVMIPRISLPRSFVSEKTVRKSWS